MNTGRNRIESLQAIRALAFLGVFSYHCRATQLGPWGVSVFIILSGFVMVYTYYDRNLDTSFKSSIKFSVGKIKKLYPLHILMLIVAAVSVPKELLINFSIKKIMSVAAKTILNITLLQAWIPSSDVYYSFNGVSWYLSVCLFLYAVFPLILKYIKKLDYKESLITAAVVYAIQILIGILLQSLNMPFTDSNRFFEWITYICPLFRLGDFIIGCCIGNAYLNKEFGITDLKASVFESILLIAIMLSEYIVVNKIGILGAEWFRYTMLFTPTSAGIILLFAINRGIISKLLSCKPILYIGNVSAYMFLIHQMLIGYFDAFCRMVMGNTLNPYVKMPIALILTIVCTELYIKLKNKTKTRQV